MDEGVPVDRGGELAVFAYGTLKQGFQNHAAYCRGFVDAFPARTWGRLYRWKPGIPILQVPEEGVLLVGSQDIERDLRDAAAVPRGRGRRPPALARWRRIRGEVLVFPDPRERLKLLDAFEGFYPHTGQPQYERVLIPIAPDQSGGIRRAWTYVLPFDREPPAQRLSTDVWEPGMG